MGKINQHCSVSCRKFQSLYAYTHKDCAYNYLLQRLDGVYNLLPAKILRAPTNNVSAQKGKILLSWIAIASYLQKKPDAPDRLDVHR